LKQIFNISFALEHTGTEASITALKLGFEYFYQFEDCLMDIRVKFSKVGLHKSQDTFVHRL